MSAGFKEGGHSDALEGQRKYLEMSPKDVRFLGNWQTEIKWLRPLLHTEA
jgi:hypothetical protein